MQTDIMLIVLSSTLLYLALGIEYINMLRRNWTAFHCATHKRPWLYLPALLIWSVIFIVFITMRMLEPLTKSRKSDWPETENQLDEYNQ